MSLPVRNFLHVTEDDDSAWEHDLEQNFAVKFVRRPSVAVLKDGWFYHPGRQRAVYLKTNNRLVTVSKWAAAEINQYYLTPIL